MKNAKKIAKVCLSSARADLPSIRRFFFDKKKNGLFINHDRSIGVLKFAQNYFIIFSAKIKSHVEFSVIFKQYASPRESILMTHIEQFVLPFD